LTTEGCHVGDLQLGAGRGVSRSKLRLAAWRAVWAARLSNPVYAACYRHLTTREHNKLRPTQAQTVFAAAILRHLHAVITTWTPPSPPTAAGPADQPLPPNRSRHQADGRGEPSAASRHT
jgi:hypothetical protein